MAWARVLGHDFDSLVESIRHTHHDVIDRYGATNPSEFFAVVTETFFEKPRQLKARGGESGRDERVAGSIADGRIGIARAGLNAERGDRVLLLAALDAQREAIAHLRNADSLGESVVERLETEIDIDEMVIRGEADRLTGAEAG